MSTGLFMGVRSSFTEESRESADALLREINLVLAAASLPAYIDPDPPPNVYFGHLFGRSALDHHLSRVFVLIAEQAAHSKQSPNLALIRDNPYRVVFVPQKLVEPQVTQYRDRIDGRPVQIWVGSLDGLLEELRRLADGLGIPTVNGQIADKTAAAINDFKPLSETDTTELIEDSRTAWLALYEGARLAEANAVALSLAG